MTFDLEVSVLIKMVVKSKSKKTYGPKSRYWCFTLNNPPKDLTFLGELPKMSYIVYQLECETTIHVQGYVEFIYQVRLAHLRKCIKKGHFEVRKGSQEQAIAYCKKAETRVSDPVEIGTKFQSKIKKVPKTPKPRCPNCKRKVTHLFVHTSTIADISYFCARKKYLNDYNSKNKT